MDGLSLNILPEQRELDREIEDAMEEREVKAVNQEELNKITAKSRALYAAREKQIVDSFNKKVDQIETIKMGRMQKRDARIQELVSESTSFIAQQALKKTAFDNQFSGILKRREILENRITSLKQMYSE